MASIVLFCCPHSCALSICFVLCAFVVVLFICLLYVSFGSSVSPSILGLMFMGSLLLCICNTSCVLYSAGSGCIFVCGVSCVDLPILPLCFAGMVFGGEVMKSVYTLFGLMYFSLYHIQ